MTVAVWNDGVWENGVAWDFLTIKLEQQIE
jgi:hypothetical protein